MGNFPLTPRRTGGTPRRATPMATPAPALTGQPGAAPLRLQIGKKGLGFNRPISMDDMTRASKFMQRFGQRTVEAQRQRRLQQAGGR